MSLVRAGVIELASLCVIVFLAAVAGGRVLAWGRVLPHGRAGRVAAGAGIGLAALALAFFAAGLVGQFNGWAAGAFVAALYLLARRRVAPFLSEMTEVRGPGLTLAEKLAGAWRSARRPALAVDWALAALALAFGVLDLVWALAPEVGTDALAYHLPIPRAYLAAGRVAVDPEWMQTAYPELVEMLFAVGLAWHWPVLAKLFHFAFGVLAVLGVWALAREAGCGRRAALWAACAFLCTPAVTFQMSTANVELAEALFAVLTALFLVRYARDPLRARWLLAAGAMAGLAIGTKHSGAAFALGGCVAVWLATRGARAPGRSPGRAPSPFLRALVFAVICAAVSSPWWLRAWVATGDPVFPFLALWFGTSPDAAGMIARWQSESLLGGYGMGRGALDLLLLPVRLVLDYDRFGSIAVGGLWLCSLPLLVWRRRSLRGLSVPLVLSAVAFSCFAFTSHQARFLTPALALFAVPVGAAVAGVRHRLAGPAVRLAALALLVLNLPWLVDMIPFGHRRAVDWPVDVIAGRASRADYVRRTWPELAPLYASLDDLVGEGGRAIAFDAPLREFTRRTVWTPADSPSAFAILSLWSAARDPEALARLRAEGVEAVVADEYMERTLFRTPFWDRVSLPVYRTERWTVRRFYDDAPAPAYSPIDASPTTVSGCDAAVTVPPFTDPPDGLSLVVLYDSASGDAGPADLVLTRGGTELARRAVPHRGRYRIEAEWPDGGPVLCVTVRLESDRAGGTVRVISAERYDFTRRDGTD